MEGEYFFHLKTVTYKFLRQFFALMRKKLIDAKVLPHSDGYICSSKAVFALA
jgi:hypothetical protein